MREMAVAGYTSRQIADDVGVTLEGCRSILKEEGIDVPADKAVGKSRRHDSNRIVGQMALEAESIPAAVNLIDFAELDPDRLGEWIDSLVTARKSLDGFIRKLIKEQQKHEAA